MTLIHCRRPLQRNNLLVTKVSSHTLHHRIVRERVYINSRLSMLLTFALICAVNTVVEIFIAKPLTEHKASRATRQTKYFGNVSNTSSPKLRNGATLLPGKIVISPNYYIRNCTICLNYHDIYAMNLLKHHRETPESIHLLILLKPISVRRPERSSSSNHARARMLVSTKA